MNKLPDISFVNGKLKNSIPVSDRGLSYGDGLFETIVYIDGMLILLDEHLQRLTKDCQRLQINLDEKKLETELAFFLIDIKNKDVSAGVVKIIITRAFSGRGYGYAKNAGSNRLIQFYSGLSYANTNLSGIRLALCDTHLSDNKSLAGIKHLNRLDQVIAQRSIKKHFYQEGIIFGAHGEVLECVSSNIFMVKDGEVFTPDLSKAGVQGVMRNYILASVLPALKLNASVKKITLDDLLSADEIFICNSVFGVWSVIAIHVKAYSCGEITAAIQGRINKLGYGKLYS